MKADKCRTRVTCFYGTLVEILGNTLTAICVDGHEHHYTVALGASIFCDGIEEKLSKLKQGSAIRMTVCKDDRKKILTLECESNVPCDSRAESRSHL